VYFLPLHANTKFNAISFLSKVIKYEPSLVVVNQATNEQIVLATAPLLTNEEDFRKYFAVRANACTGMNKQHLIIGCKLLSKHTFSAISSLIRISPSFLNG